MTERTVTVELTETELKRLRTAWSCLFPATELHEDTDRFVYDMDGKIVEALNKVRRDTEREAKEQALRAARLFSAYCGPSEALDRINESGWDLVRIGDGNR